LSNLQINVPDKLEGIFNPKEFFRYNILKGGRGGGKSWGVAQLLLIKGYQQKRLVLCTREIQRTIADSVHRILAETIERLGFDNFYEVQKNKIIGKNGTEFIYSGLQNPSGIKSAEGITDIWIEEAAKVTKESWKFIIPTIRKEGSQFYIVFNPDEEDDPVNDLVNTPRPQTQIIDINHSDNPFLSDVLRQEMEYDKEHDFDSYLHVWEGGFWTKSDDQIMKGIWEVQDFETHENADFLYGADFGFSQDPSTGNRLYIKDNTIYIDYEVHGHAVRMEDMPDLYRGLPGAETNTIVGDSSRPETIDFLRRNGLPMFTGSVKGKNSIVDGIEFIRKHNVIIHPRCKHTIQEFKFYKYKRDPKTDDISKIILDKNNHHMDNIRYSLEGIRKRFRPTNISAGQLGL